MQHIDSVRATRAQIAKENEERLQDDIASASSEAEPVSLADVFDFQDSFFEQEPVPTPVEECPKNVWWIFLCPPWLSLILML